MRTPCLPYGLESDICDSCRLFAFMFTSEYICYHLHYPWDPDFLLKYWWNWTCGKIEFNLGSRNEKKKARRDQSSSDQSRCRDLKLPGDCVYKLQLLPPWYQAGLSPLMQNLLDIENIRQMLKKEKEAILKKQTFFSDLAIVDHFSWILPYKCENCKC